jgi:hypothetical protein
MNARRPNLKRIVFTSCVVLAAVGGGATARAATVYATGFENPPFASGSQLLGQDGWSTAIPPFLNPSGAVIATAAPASGQQHVQVSGAALQAAAEVAPYTAIGSYRRPVDYDTAATGLRVVRVQADVRLDGPATTVGTDAAAASLAARSGSGPVGEIEISSDGRVNAFAANVAPGAAPTFSAPVTLGAYHTLLIEVDFAADTYRFFVDGAALGTPLAFEPGFTSDVLSRGALVTYTRLAADGRDDYTYRFDNFSVSAVPEPGGLAALAAAGVGLVARRRGRRGRSNG